MPLFTTFPRKQSNWVQSDWSRPVLKEPVVEEKPMVTVSRPEPRFTVFGNNKSRIALINSRHEPEIQIERKTTQKKVRFDPVFLEKVCLFSETQSPFELKGVQQRTPHFRLVCPHWNVGQRQPILVDKRWFSVKDNHQQIKGQVMVRNLALDKSVSIHYTSDRWSTVREVDGVFFGPNPKNVTFDIYEFTMDLDDLADHGEVRSRIEFTVRLTAGVRDYHDNNRGRNYIIKVIADPLNWTKDADDEILEDDEYPTEEEEEEEKEKHTSFTNALKEYQHAKPLHLKTRTQFFLGSRYDFSQSLSLAKEPSLNESNIFPKPFIKPSSPPPDHVHILDNMYVPHATPPTSPSSSPKLTSMDIHSSSYEDILNKYCFYDSKKTL
ncbi:hypothetical protein G6F56_001637 [Rhizopus delemar]|uniref:CBM21 domain-containing protein n=1 Tax=Rhizopus stolonifer TaxID=4846 RepID=A0A367KWN6_RHIST|nr:hypothetical protein G6F56_001637 [Rhizopus delemar]RCI06567.1 hypothetical protein CU098_012279 [Rhizopus stolonifer]